MVATVAVAAPGAAIVLSSSSSSPELPKFSHARFPSTSDMFGVWFCGGSFVGSFGGAACSAVVPPCDASHATMTPDSMLGSKGASAEATDRPALARARCNADLMCGHAAACAASDVPNAATSMRRIAMAARARAKSSRNSEAHSANSREAHTRANAKRRPNGLAGTAKAPSRTATNERSGRAMSSVAAAAAAHSSAVEHP